MTEKAAPMPEAIIHTTVGQLAHDLAPFAGSRRVEVRVLDATEDESRASVRRAVEEADDDPVSLTEGEVFGDISRMLQERHGTTR